MTHIVANHRVEIGAGALAFALGSILALTSGCSSPASAAALSEPSPVVIERATVEERAVPRSVALTGTLVPNREADVTSDAAGRVLLLTLLATPVAYSLFDDVSAWISKRFGRNGDSELRERELAELDAMDSPNRITVSSAAE